MDFRLHQILIKLVDFKLQKQLKFTGDLLNQIALQIQEDLWLHFDLVDNHQRVRPDCFKLGLVIQKRRPNYFNLEQVEVQMRNLAQLQVRNTLAPSEQHFQ